MSTDEHMLALGRQLALVEPGAAWNGRLYPCSVELYDGTSLRCVYIGRKADFERWFGAGRPPEVYGPAWIEPGKIRTIKESPQRLPARFATELSRNETGMSYWIFTVKFAWFWRHQYFQQFVDFLDYPRWLGPSDLRSIVYHRGKRDVKLISRLPIYYCVLDCPDGGE
jgi:hypothetical protein